MTCQNFNNQTPPNQANQDLIIRLRLLINSFYACFRFQHVSLKHTHMMITPPSITSCFCINYDWVSHVKIFLFLPWDAFPKELVGRQERLRDCNSVGKFVRIAYTVISTFNYRQTIEISNSKLALRFQKPKACRLSVGKVNSRHPWNFN